MLINGSEFTHYLIKNLEYSDYLIKSLEYSDRDLDVRIESLEKQLKIKEIHLEA
jgi:hypothetical protein